MTITKEIELEQVVCGTCGINHAVPKEWIENKRKEAGNITCPNGCLRGWSESEAQKLRKQLEQKERELRESKCETLRNAQLRVEAEAARVKAEKKLRRAVRGICTCCNRSFLNLSRHMQTKHPEALK